MSSSSVSMTKSSRRNEESEVVKDCATSLLDVFKTRPEVKDTTYSCAPELCKFIENVAAGIMAKGTLAYSSAAVYFIGTVVLSYSFSVEAEEPLIEAETEKEEINMIFKSKVKELLKGFEKIHTSSENFEGFCEQKKTIKGYLKETLSSIQEKRRNIELKLLVSVPIQEKNTLLQFGSSVGVAVGSVVSLGMPVIGLALGTASIFGLFKGTENKQALKKVTSILEEAKTKAFMAETRIEKAITKAKLFFIGYQASGEKNEELEELKRSLQNIQRSKC